MEEKNKEMEEKNKIFFRIPLHELYSDSLKYDNTPDKSNAVRKYFMERYTVLLNDFRMFQKITKRKPLIFIGTGLSFKSGIIKWYDSLCYMANRFKELNSDLGNNKLEEEVINSVFDT
ncbi:MAG: hypothetical protein H8D45_05730, partial [Bacteroidetes bacterium]|nr:hypothetical protein [Bacteroidota bacterium]